MSSRMIDVLTDEERGLTTLISAAQRNLLSINNQVKSVIDDHCIICANITRDKKARDVLVQELHDLGERIATHKSRTNPDEAEEAYKVLKPDRYDVELFEVPNHQHQGALTYFVKMHWGNVSRVIYQGELGNMANVIAQRISDLTGKGTYKTRKVKSKKDIWK